MSMLAGLFENDNEMDMKQKIVEELLNTDNNLETKTQMNKPLKWSCLQTIDEFIESKKLPKSAGILGNFMKTSYKYLISSDRKGRLEYIEALKSLSNLENEQQLDTSKLMRAT